MLGTPTEAASLAIKHALRPPRAGSADADRHAMRAALRRVQDEYQNEAARLRAAGYESAQAFSDELSGLLESNSQELTSKLLAAIFGEPPWGDAPRTGRLGRLLGLI
jgi:hypothetical protein